VLDSIYFTVETISTVGFGDFSFSGQAPWLEAFGVLLIVLGAAILTTLFSLITNGPGAPADRPGRSAGRSHEGLIAHDPRRSGRGRDARPRRLLARGQEVVVVEHDEATAI